MDAALFDWDGTLLDSLPSLYQANVAVMAAFGLPFDEPAYRQRYAADWRTMYRRFGIAHDELERANAVWHAAFDGAPEANLFPGVCDALGRLGAAGLRLGLVTAGHRAIVAPQLARHGLEGAFDVVVFGDDLPVHKPDPRPLRRALAVLGLQGRPGDAAYVGDTRDDMAMAREAGVHAEGIASLLGDPDDLRASGAEVALLSVGDWASAMLAGETRA